MEKWSFNAELSVFPIGGESTSVSKFVKKAVDAIEEVEDVTFQVTPMGTVIQTDDFEKLLETVRNVNKRLQRTEAKRMEFLLKVDCRSDK